MSSTSDNGYDSELENMEGAEGGGENEGPIVEVVNNEGSSNMNPLLFPDVISGVLSHLSASEVESCRLVSRLWNIEACKVLKNKRIVVFMDGDAIKVYNNAMKDTTLFPHAQFEICTDLSNEHFAEFWSIFGTQIKSLDLRISSLSWRDFLEVVESNVPNLEKLSLRFLPRQEPRGKIDLESKAPIRSVKQLRLASIPIAMNGSHGAIERLTGLLKLLPNLEVIELLRIKQVCMQSRVSQSLVEVLRKPEVNLPFLKKLNVNLVGITSEVLESLALKRLPLERVEMGLVEGVKATSYKDFLLSLRSTLTHLKISYPETFSNYQPFLEMNDAMKPEECVQVLTKLKSLNMINFKGSINFIHKMPGLTKLIYATNNLKDSIPLGLRRMPYVGHIEDHSLHALKITSPNCPADTISLDAISRCFPYLKSLDLHHVDDEGLGVIYRGLPLLSVLKLISSSCSDQGLTGIPLEICNDMVETGIFTVPTVDLYRRDLYIGSLPFLRTLAVSSPKISDASIAFGVVACKNLKELQIGSPLISDKAIIFLSNRVCKDMDVLDISKCSKLTEQSTFYAHEKLVGKVIVPVSTEGEEQGEPSRAASKKKTLKLQLELEKSDRGMVKMKRGSSASASRMSSPDTLFFEEIETEHYPPFPFQDANRRRNVRIRVHAFRRFDNPFRGRHHMD
ncbi:F-box/LRR-repeat protein 13 [Orchesella cincta]|uniref:F-box/LRR-repeat protein 13 n=1 Tax=Orchesella cincta TaxID=48709 RepID=A0A1D2NAU8_ORCCI|nr:F-box/LRR-repeat protein 13 [Orchesella cincta]